MQLAEYGRDGAERAAVFSIPLARVKELDIMQSGGSWSADSQAYLAAAKKDVAMHGWLVSILDSRWEVSDASATAGRSGTAVDSTTAAFCKVGRCCTVSSG